MNFTIKINSNLATKVHVPMLYLRIQSLRNQLKTVIQIVRLNMVLMKVSHSNSQMP